MGTLKGQNLRILLRDSTYVEPTYIVIAKSTNCTITQGTQTDDASTKDDVGMASKPTITSKNWSVSVESLDVLDMAAMLTAIKGFKEFVLVWDVTDTSDNQSILESGFARTGTAILNDATFVFDDRTNSTKQIQFMGIGSVEEPDSVGSLQTVIPVNDTFTKGQFVRLFLSSDNTTAPAKVIAAAKSLQVHVSVQMESATTKDTEGDYEVQEPVGISYDISTSALVSSGESITSQVGANDLIDIQDIYENGTPVKFQIANVSGANNRTKGTVIMSGSVIISQLTINAPNRQNATYDAQLQGYGNYTVGA